MSVVLRVGSRVQYHPEAARKMLPVDRVNREKLMALRGHVTGFRGLEWAMVEFPGHAAIEVELAHLEPAD